MLRLKTGRTHPADSLRGAQRSQHPFDFVLQRTIFRMHLFPKSGEELRIAAFGCAFELEGRFP